MSDNVCEGVIGDISSGDTGIEMECPDQTRYRFPDDDIDSAKQEARRVLKKKGYNAELSDTR